MALQMKKITDPEILKRLNAGEYEKSTKITDPEILKQLNAGEYERKGNPTEKPTVSSDIINSLSNAPGAITDFIANLPGQVIDSAGLVAQNPVRATGKLGAGIVGGIKGGLNIPSNIARYMQSRGVGEEDKDLRDLIAKLHIPDTGLEKAIFGAPQKGDEFLESLGSFAPWARAGGWAKGLEGMAKRGGAAAAYATGQEQDPLQAALMGLGGEGLVRGVQRIGKPGTFLPSSPLSSPELKQAMQTTKGTETDLGNVIQNPFLKEQFENTLPKIIASGANQTMQRTANEITRRGETILDYLKGNEEVPDIGEKLHSALKSAYEDTRAQKNERFKTLNEAAEKEGIKTKRSNLIETAKEKLAEVERDPHRAGLMDTKAKALLKNIVNPGKEEEQTLSQIPIGAAGKDILQHLFKTGKNNKLNFTEAEFAKAFGKTGAETAKAFGKNAPTKQTAPQEFSLQDTDLLRGDFGDLANDAYTKGEGALSNLYKSLKDAATKDINDEIDKSNNPKLNSLRDEAMDFYKKEYAPFKDKEIKKFTLRGGDADLLMQNFLKNSKLSDRGNLLGKLTSKLSSEDKDLLAYSYFSNAIKEGKLNPSRLNTLYKNLGKKQKNALLSEGMQSVLKDYSQLVQKNSRPLDIMFNPKTGYAGLSEIPWKSLGTGGAIGTAIGGWPGAAIGAAFPSVLGRVAVKGLTNQKMREFLIERMIKAREKEGIPPRNIAPLVQALMQVSNPQRQEETRQ